jgi:hypothetical protein
MMMTHDMAPLKKEKTIEKYLFLFKIRIPDPEIKGRKEVVSSKECRERFNRRPFVD